MILDAHSQFGPSLVHSRDPFGPLWKLADGAQLLALMDKAAIDRSLCFAPLWCGGDAFYDPEYRQANDVVFEGVAKSSGRLVGLARVSPRYGARAVAELDRCFSSYDAKGIMLDPEADGFALTDMRLMAPLMERCAERKAIAFFRCGFPPAQPAGLLPLAETYPGVRFIISNLGLRIGADAAAIAKRCPNVYLETSLQTASVIRAVLGSLDLERVLFGSNAPFGIPQAEIKKVNALPKISDEHKRNVLGENLSRLLAS